MTQNEPDLAPNQDEPSIRDRLLGIIATEGMIDREKLTQSATLDDIGIQSVDVVIILNAIEDEFGIYVPIDQTMNDIKTVDDLVSAITQLLKDSQSQSGS